MTLNIVDGNHYGMWSSASKRNSLGYFTDLVTQIKQRSGKVVVLWDGSSWRYDAFPAYKANRQENAEILRIKKEWGLIRKEAGKILHALGAQQILVSNYEADDLAGMICRAKKGEKIRLFTSDMDWAQLCDFDKVWWIDKKNGRTIKCESMFLAITGFNTPQELREGKALCGDKSDNISSVGDFGKKTAQELFSTFGTVRAAINSSLTEPEKIDTCSKRLRSFCEELEKHQKYEESLRLIDISSPGVAPKPGKVTNIEGKFNEQKLAELNVRHSLFEPGKMRDMKEIWADG